ncbi:MAG: hypothetical protein M3Y41_04485, partial [Pseudomonadota bacterium]|nr:hypothetical protein [Pseudomonadota bacterium]
MPPPALWFTGVNDATLTVSGGRPDPLVLTQPRQSGDNIAMQMVAIAPVAQTFDVLVQAAFPNQAHYSAGMSLRNSSSGKISNLLISADDSGAGGAIYSTPATFSAGLGTTSAFDVTRPAVLRATFDGTNWTLGYSLTGAAGSFVQIAQASAASLGSPDQIGCFVDAYGVNDGGPASLTVYGWELTASTNFQAASSATIAAAQQSGGSTPGQLPAVSIKALNNIPAGALISVGHFFARNDVPSNTIRTMTATASGQTVQVQPDNINTYPDAGSLRSATLSWRTPVAISAGSTVSFQLGASGSAVGTTGIASSQITNNRDFKTVFAGNTGSVRNAFGGSQWSSSTGFGASPTRGWRQTMAGPLVTEFEVFDFAGPVKHRAWVRVFPDASGNNFNYEYEPLLANDHCYG